MKKRMRSPKPQRKLSLQRETLRLLTEGEMKPAAGGYLANQAALCPSDVCTNDCCTNCC